MPNFMSFLTYAVITNITPGPNNIMSMTNAGKHGFRKALPFSFGVGLGFFLIMAACAAFSHLLLAWLPSAELILKMVGALYILWLAFKILRSSYNQGGKTSTTLSFPTAVLLQFVNPKVILYGVTVMSNYVTPYYTDFFSLSFFVVALSLLGLLSNFIWLVFGAVFNRFFIRHTKAVNLVMALLLVYCAVSIFL